MSASWLIGVTVTIVGGLAGAVVAGRPVPGDSFVLEPSSTATESPSTSEPVVATTVAATTTLPPSTSVPPTAASTTTPSPSTTPTTPTPATPTPATTPTTTPTTTTSEVPATTADAGPFPRDQVQLVIANGDGRFQLATITADRLRALGYTVDLAQTSYPTDETVVFYRPGFEREATNAAADIGVPNAVILAYSSDGPQITDSDANGDIIVVLGPDAPRR